MISEEKAKELSCPFIIDSYRLNNKCKGSICMAWFQIEEISNSAGNIISVGYCKLIGDT